MREYDEITSFLGTWGPFQRLVFFSLAFSILPNGLVGIYIVFVADTPPHECLVPEESNISESWRNVSVPLVLQDGALKLSSCSRYRLDLLRNFSRLNYAPDVDVNVSQIQQEGCLDGWKYSKEIYQSTIVTEWDLVCENEYKEPLASSIYFLGVLVGTFISGQLSDRYGRRPVLFATMAMQTLTIFIQIFSPSWEAFSAIFFFIGFSGFSNYVVGYVLGSEILSPGTRAVFCSLGVFMASGVGQMFLPLFAYFLRDWRLLIIPMAASGLLYIPLWWLIPESPRWLLSQGRVEEAEAILRDAARMNKVPVPEVIFTPAEIMEAQEKREKRYNMLDILRSRQAVALILVCSILWMVITMSYFGLLFNTTNLHGDPYFNFFLSAIVEIPAYFMALLLLKFCPRRFCQSSSLFLGGTIILLIQLVPRDLPGVAIFLEMVGKFGITTAFCVVYAVTAELFPTVIRNMAMGTCSMAARIGTIISPFIIYLGNYYKYLPYLLIGSLAVFLGMLCFVLPETFGKVLPDTLAEMQSVRGMGRSKKTTMESSTKETVDDGPLATSMMKEMTQLSVKEQQDQSCKSLSHLIRDPLFLVSFVHTLEEQKNFIIKDKCMVASLLTLALHDDLPYLTQVMEQLLVSLMEQPSNAHPKLLLRRTESIVEKLLTNWMSVCLYGFLRECVGQPLYLLVCALTEQISKGPVDSVTGKALYTLSENDLLSQAQDFSPLKLNVLFAVGTEGEVSEPLDVCVLDCDTVEQVKEKILLTFHRKFGFRYTQQLHDIDIEFEQSGCYVALQEVDSSSEMMGEVTMLNTLKHYRIPDGSTIKVITRKVQVPKSPTLSFKEEPDFQTKYFHLIDPELADNKNSQGKKLKVKEVYLTKLLSTKVAVHSYVENLFKTIWGTSDNRPPHAVKYFFDFLDSQGENKNISDPDVLHIWKTNSLPLRFWVNILKNPQFVFDLEKTPLLDGCLSVIAQAFMDSFSLTEQQLGMHAPTNKLLYAKDIPQYKQEVKTYYKKVQEQPALSSRKFKDFLQEESKKHENEFNESAALCEIYKFIHRYFNQIEEKLEQITATSRLKEELQQVRELFDSKKKSSWE